MFLDRAFGHPQFAGELGIGPAASGQGLSHFALSRCQTGSDGGSWSLQPEECFYHPDQQGPFATLWAASGSTDSGAELGFFESVPADGEGTVVIGSFVDEGADIVYVVIEATASADDSTLTVSVGMHDNPLRAVGDPIDLTATLTCSL